MLVLGVVLGIVQIVAASHAASLQRSYRWTAGLRDGAAPLPRGVAGRLDRALHNFLETFLLFAAVVLVAHASDTHNALTGLGAQLYFRVRVVYVPLYAAGIPPILSIDGRHPAARRAPAVGIERFARSRRHARSGSPS